jgi:DNA-binding CsgD family transcriptional regulator
MKPTTRDAAVHSVYREYLNFLERDNPGFKQRETKYYLRRYGWLQHIIETLPSIVFMINFATGKYPFMAGAFKQITGFEPNATDPGVAFTMDRMHPDDSSVYSNVCFEKFLEYCRGATDEQIANSRFSVNWRWLRADRTYVQLLQQYVVLERDDKRNPILNLGTITDISNYKTGNNVIFSISRLEPDGNFLTVVHSSDKPLNNMNISEREREVLSLVVCGLTSKSIAIELYLSIHTVKAHRRSLLNRTGCINTAELCRYAVSNGLV